MAHYGMQPTWNNVTIAHENGDVEQSHHRFKEAVDQALRVRASRDFPTRAAYEHFLARSHPQTQSNQSGAFSAKKKRPCVPLPTRELAPCKELRVMVVNSSTITVKANGYSVPSRLMGTSVLVRVRRDPGGLCGQHSGLYDASPDRQTPASD